MSDKGTLMFKQTFRSLKYINYRIYFIGQVISLCGGWIQSVALSWLAYKLTGSAVMLALVAFASQIPCIVFTPLAGVLADRANRRVMLIIIQIFAMVQAVILTILTLTGLLNIYYILPLSLMLGILTAMETPVRHSFYSDLIDNLDDRGNAIALNSTMINLTRLVGPAIAGVLIPLIGEGFCFLFNAVSYCAIIISLILIKTIRSGQSTEHKRILTEMKAGFLYVSRTPPIRTLLILISAVSFGGMSVTVLFPIFAKVVFSGGAGTLGVIMSSFGAGSITGALILAHRRTVLGLTRHIQIAVYITGFSLALLPFVGNIYIACIITGLFGFGFISMIASCNTILQTIADDKMRGRVMSFYTLAFMGMIPLGSMILGWLTEIIGVVLATCSAGVFTIITAVIFSLRIGKLRSYIKPVYVAKGIMLPD